MGRRKERPLDALIRLPWWVSAIGLAATLAAREIWLASVAKAGTGMFRPIVEQAAYLFFVPVLLFGFGLVFSLIRQLLNARLLNKAVSFEVPIDDFHWRDFERTVQEAFRRQGYLAVETRSGADGGYDIGLRKDGKLYLVQCKHWKTRSVGVSVARELWGIVAARKAAGGFVVTSSTFTQEAHEFARTVDLQLIDGEALKKMLGVVQTTEYFPDQRPIFLKDNSSPACPKCGSRMIRRTARQGSNAGKDFWGCSTFPECRGVLNFS